jgi:DNA 3'-phosphatase
MSFQEVITPRGHILYWQPTDSHQTNSKKILGMDLDWTLIRPVKGKIHPLDETDWQFLYNNLQPIKQKQLEGYKFVIFTNQGGLLTKKSGQMGVDQFKTRWYHILDKLEKEHGITNVYMLVSLYDDFNRKPSIGMWDYMEIALNGYVNSDVNIKVDRDKSLYIGDMAGRKNDHSASDLLFAMNLGFEFQVPELFFVDDSSPKNKTAKLKKDILADESIFNGQQFIETFDKKISKSNKAISQELQTILEDNSRQLIVLFVGSPASGKSSYYHRYLADIKGLEYLSMDTFKGTPSKFMKYLEAKLITGLNIIIDNTNGTKKARAKFINLARSNELKDKITIIVIHMATEKKICMHLNALRTKLNNTAILQEKQDGDGQDRHNVPAVALHTYWKNFQVPNTDEEDIDIIYTVDFEPSFITEIDNIEENKYKLTKKDFMLLI